MRLSNLIASSDGVALQGVDVDITGLTTDSRQVRPGFLFIATPGIQQDGRNYINDALAQGAVAVLLPPGSPPPVNASALISPDIRKSTAELAAAFYSLQPECLAAVTGTSGKTSTAQFVRQIWQALGYRSASIGTLGLVTETGSQYGSLTTPDAVTLHRLLDDCATQHVSHVAIEASSHGIDLKRLDRVRFKAAGFTNLSRDHLDYHGTMEAYLAAKLRLFTHILPSRAAAVLNADIPEYEALHRAARARGHEILAYGRQGQDIRLTGVQVEAGGQRLKIELFGQKREGWLPVMGDFQVWNALCALGLVIGCGADPEAAVAALAQVSGIPGRLQYIGSTRTGGKVFVDYAHKPDALENVLRGMRRQAVADKGRLGVVFGCGGNRDKGKRPLMGAIASQQADWAIVTDDNPRDEDPAAIRREVLAGCAGAAHVREIGDRAQAIAEAIARLQANDLLIIAGKGHETGQIFGDRVLPFDDAAEARKALE